MKPAVAQFFRALWPLPNRTARAPGRAAWWPAAVFLLLYGSAVVGLELAAVVRWHNKPAFWLLLFVPWIWRMAHGSGAGLTRGRALTALFCRLLIAGVLIAALARPNSVRKSDTLGVVFALDVSDSMGARTQDEVLAWVMKQVAAKPEKDEAGLVIFGRQAAVELPPARTFPFEAINSRVTRDASNLAAGLELASAVLPDGQPGRVVLISDGNETEGAAGPLLDSLKARGIAVDVLPVSFDFNKETWVERLDLPRAVKSGETYEAGVVVNALQPGKGRLMLAENGREIFSKDVEFSAGKNRFSLPLHLREAGYYEYAARLETSVDSWRENNVAMGDLYLKGKGRVLVVTGPQSDARDWEAFVGILKKNEREVRVQLAYEFPRDVGALLPYDLVVFANAPADAFDAKQLATLRDAVFEQGTGFLMLGSPQSYGPGGYHRTPIEEILPVAMDASAKKILPKAALAIVLHTCEFAEGNYWAKVITKDAIRVLGKKDEVGVLDYSFDSKRNGMGWIFPLTPAGDFERLAMLVNNASPGDMPDFQSGMQMAFTGLKASDAAVKHLIVISDGDPSPPTPALVGQYQTEKITISMVAIKPHGGSDVEVMRRIADATGGRYYFVDDPKTLPSIFLKEAKTVKRSMLQNRVFTPQVVAPSPVLKGIEAMPELRGYVITGIKPRASLILQAPADPEAQADEPDPILAIWRHGLGNTAAWTSDFAPNWAQSWLEWDKTEAFVRQLVTEVARVERTSQIHLTAQAAGTDGLITVEDFAPDAGMLEMSARVVAPSGEKTTVALRQTGPRRYEGSFPLTGTGRYAVTAIGAGSGGRTEQASGGFAQPYSTEYLRFRSNIGLLRQIADRTGGRVLDTAATELFPKERQPRERTRPIFDWFLLALACLIPLDVALRRVQLDWETVRGWFRRAETRDSEGTLGTLLSAKKSRPAAEPSRSSRPAPSPASHPPRPASPPPPTAEKPAAPTEPGHTENTLDRLLAAKRKKKD